MMHATGFFAVCRCIRIAFYLCRWSVATCLDLGLLPLAGLLLVVAWFRKYVLSASLSNRARIAMDPSCSSDKIGVLLIHGSGFNSIQWLFGQCWLAWYLPRHTFSCIHALDYAGLASNVHEHGIDTYARGQIHKQLVKLQKETGVSCWIMIGHSMGGLIASYYQEYMSADILKQEGVDILHTFTIASPWKGSPLIDSVISSARMPQRYTQMRPHSIFLQQLYERAYAHRTHYTSFGSDVDAMVPGDRSILDASTRSHLFSWVGHYALVVYPPLWNKIVDQINIIVVKIKRERESQRIEAL